MISSFRPVKPWRLRGLESTRDDKTRFDRDSRHTEATVPSDHDRTVGDALIRLRDAPGQPTLNRRFFPAGRWRFLWSWVAVSPKPVRPPLDRWRSARRSRRAPISCNSAGMTSTGKTSTGPRNLKGVNTGVRLGVSLAVGIAIAVIVALLGAGRYAPAVGWDAAAVTLLLWLWFTIWPMGAEATAERATREDPTRPLSDTLLLAAAVVSLAAVGFFLLQASSAKGSTQDILAGVGVATVILSWLVVHSVFTLRYAMLYYTGKDGGVNFNQSAPPRYSDFAYLAFTLGMTFQVSDTDLETPAIRATALRHALLSYLFGAVILATTINLVAGLASSSGGG